MTLDDSLDILRAAGVLTFFVLAAISLWATLDDT